MLPVRSAICRLAEPPMTSPVQVLPRSAASRLPRSTPPVKVLVAPRVTELLVVSPRMTTLVAVPLSAMTLAKVRRPLPPPRR